MVFMAMLHGGDWRPNHDEAEQAERQDKMNDLSSSIASIEVAKLVRRMSFFERATRELLDKPEKQHEERKKTKITLPRLKFLEQPMPPDIEPPRKPKPPRRKALPRHR
jgi:hypothetical protein